MLFVIDYKYITVYNIILYILQFTVLGDIFEPLEYNFFVYFICTLK